MTRPAEAPPLREGGIRALLWPHRQYIPCEATKIVVAVTWAWSRRRPPHVVERLILELIITVIIPYYFILLFLLFRVVVGSSGREGAMINEEHH